MADQIFQIQIALKGTKPKIWRRILIQSDKSLLDFHKIIQTTMGWTNSHLHHFIKDQTFYTIRYPNDDLWGFSNNVDYKKKKIKISDLLRLVKDKIAYEYDFGDGWLHVITLEKILPYDSTQKYPICIAGKRNCPPEDCGGIWGYAGMLQVLENPAHEEYSDLTDWLGEDFDPEYFDKTEINALLTEKNYGCN